MAKPIKAKNGPVEDVLFMKEGLTAYRNQKGNRSSIFVERFELALIIQKLANLSINPRLCEVTDVD